MAVKDNLLVIRMGVAGLTQWGSSWPRETVWESGGIRKNCGNLWKKQRPKEEGNAETQRSRGEVQIPTFRAARRRGQPPISSGLHVWPLSVTSRWRVLDTSVL